MSSQEHNGIPFSIAHEQQQRFRLLELPETLLELLTSPDPPQLSIKSSTNTTSPTPSNPAHAVLCTPTQTYHLRQVQTSNSIFVTHPTHLAPTPTTANNNDDEDATPSTGLSAIAACNSTLELLPAAGSALPYLKAALPLWDGDGLGQDPSVMEPDTQSPEMRQDDIFAHIPFSPAECLAAWTELRAFVAADGACYRPSASGLMRLWRAVLAASIAEDVDLEKRFRVRDLWGAVCDVEEGVPLALVEACVRGLTPEGEEGPDGWARINRATCVRWVGATLLESQGARPLLTARFLDEWRESLPEKWRGDATLEVIRDVYALPSQTEIVSRSEASSTGSGSTAGVSSGKAVAGTRNWHERFKKGRR